MHAEWPHTQGKCVPQARTGHLRLLTERPFPHWAKQNSRLIWTLLIPGHQSVPLPFAAPRPPPPPPAVRSKLQAEEAEKEWDGKKPWQAKRNNGDFVVAFFVLFCFVFI